MSDLEQKFLKHPGKITVDDCDRLLTSYGYELHRDNGSQRVYHKKNTTPIIIAAPHGTKYLKSNYIKKIVRLLGLEESGGNANQA
jgi:predicted RNA binding protein YcfA (HicA-like mRNA interferase family)